MKNINIKNFCPANDTITRKEKYRMGSIFAICKWKALLSQIHENFQKINENKTSITMQK